MSFSDVSAAFMAEYSVFKVPTAGWFRPAPNDPTELVRVDKETDPIVALAKRLDVNGIIGKDLADAESVTVQQNVRLISELGAMRAELEETKAKLAVALNVEHINAASGNNPEAETLRARVQELEAEVSSLQSRLTMAEGEALTLRSQAAAAATAPAAPADDEVLELRRKVATLEVKNFDAAYDNATLEQELDTSRRANAAKSAENATLQGRVTQLEADLRDANARAAAAPTPPPAQPAPGPAPQHPAFVTRTAEVITLINRNNNLKLGLIAAALLLVFFAASGVNGYYQWMFGPAKQQQAVSQQPAASPSPLASTTPSPTPANADCSLVEGKLRQANEELGRKTSAFADLQKELDKTKADDQKKIGELKATVDDQKKTIDSQKTALQAKLAGPTSAPATVAPKEEDKTKLEIKVDTPKQEPSVSDLDAQILELEKASFKPKCGYGFVYEYGRCVPL